MAEVQYFTHLAVLSDGPGDAWIWKNIAVVTMFLSPSSNLLKLLYQTVSACQCLEEDVHVINVISIAGIVGMALHQFLDVSDCNFIMEQPGLDIPTFGVSYEGEDTQDDMADDEDHDD